MKVPHPIPYQGSKRNLAKCILQFFPYDIQTLFEPFSGKDVLFILSYDGRTGQQRYGQLLPKELGLYRFEIEAGRSTQATLLGRHEITYESVYVSKNLVVLYK